MLSGYSALSQADYFAYNDELRKSWQSVGEAKEEQFEAYKKAMSEKYSAFEKKRKHQEYHQAKKYGQISRQAQKEGGEAYTSKCKKSVEAPLGLSDSNPKKSLLATSRIRCRISS